MVSIPFIKNLDDYQLRDLPNDIIAGVVIAALTIPIALGYATVAGLPAVYGLYGSILPLIVFALFTGSKTLVFGMDAAGSAITGSVLIGAGITFQSPEALTLVPLISLFAGFWLLIFSLFKAGRFVAFISLPVMGGFITGIALSIMAGQVVQMAGVSFSHGEFLESVTDLAFGMATGEMNVWSVLLGAATVALLETSKRVIPKMPMVLVVLVGAIVAAHFFDFASIGVDELGALPAGLPPLGFALPSFGMVEQALTMSLMVAVVVAIESIIADTNFSQKGGYDIDDNHEIASFGFADIASGICGASPASASVSRTAAAAQYHAKSQIANLVAALAIIIVCLFLTPHLGRLPMPILAGIVFSALCGVCEFDLASRLHRVSRDEFWVFIAVMSSVLLVGILFGVACGIVLSFLFLLHKTVNPPRYFMGIAPDSIILAPVRPSTQTRPITNVVVYRLAGSLFFANCRTVGHDINSAVTADTQAIFFDMSMISSIDLSAGERLVAEVNKWESKGIPFYVIGMNEVATEEVRKYELELGSGEKAHVAPTVDAALSNSGLSFELSDGTVIPSILQ